MMTGRERGQVSVRNVGAAASAGGPVYAVISTTGGDALGQARGDRDGTGEVWTATPTAANDTVYGLAITFAPWDGEDAETFVLDPVTSDGSGTQTEISDAIKAVIAGASFARLRELVSVSAAGAATVILTGLQLGRPFVVTDSADPGAWTSITRTTSAAQYTKRVPGARWDEAVAADAVGKIHLNF
jgi:hypothetical protein